MKIKPYTYVFPLNDSLVKIIEKEISNLESSQTAFYILNFRDPDYSAEAGGFHPVEIMLDQTGLVQYITDFAYVGQGGMAELAKEIDFEFSSGICEHLGYCYSLEQCKELFDIWQQNFCAYYDMGVFKVTVSIE